MKRSTCLLVVLSAVAAVTAQSGTTAARPAQSPLDGRWRQTAAVTAQELIARGMPPKMAATTPKLEKPALDFNAGRFRVFDLASGRTIGAGRYAVTERSVRVVFTSAPSIKPLVGGRVSWLSWSACTATGSRSPRCPAVTARHCFRGRSTPGRASDERRESLR